jgi:23S rRNA pseudouridine1911/1915/1917 synthase
MAAGDPGEPAGARPVATGGGETTVAAGAEGCRLDRWLAAPERLGSRRRALDALSRGRVWVDGIEQRPDDAARPLREGQRVRLWMDRPGSATRRGPRRAGPLTILYEDADLLVLSKPAGLLTVPQPGHPEAPSLADLVEAHWRSRGKRPALPVHRLDRDTSGPVVFARTGRAQAHLKDQFASRTPERVYHAVVQGAPEPRAGSWRTWLRWEAATRIQRVVAARTPRSHEAIARYRVLETFGPASLVEVRLVTGRRHQVRAQAWVAGHPLVGERLYVGPPAPAPSTIAFARQALHGVRLAFAHPRTGERLAFDVPPPADFAALVERLRGAASAYTRGAPGGSTR